MASPDLASIGKTTARTSGPSAVVCLWLAAAAAAVADGLDAPVRASWQAVPLRTWASRAATLAGLPVVVDRRLDPETPITLAGDGRPLGDVLAAAAAAAGAEAVTLRSSVRIVPRGQPDLCARAEEARERELARLPAGPRAKLRERSPWAWPEAARPRDLVAAVAAESGVAVEGIDGLPHDHLPAAEFPALSRAEKLDLVLAHFDRRVAWRSRDGGAAGAIVPLATNLPPARPAARKPDKPARGGKASRPQADVFSLQVAAPLEDALAAVAAQCGLGLDLDRDSLQVRGIAPREIVRADLQDVSRSQLLDALLEPLGLAWRIEADRLRVFAPPPEATP